MSTSTTSRSTGTCCGRPRQVVVLGDSAGADLRLLRCTTCARREWQAGDGATVAPGAALEVLGAAYREAPRRARAARDRAAGARAARSAARAAARRDAREDAREDAPEGGPGSAARSAGREAAPPREELAALLQGWTVLGATG